MSLDAHITGIEPPAAVDLASQWVALATEQRDYGSHLETDANRARIEEMLARYAAREQVLVARATTDAPQAVSPEGEPTDSDTERIVGFVMYRTRESPYELDCSRGLIENLYVVPECRNQDIGSELLESAESRMADRGLDRVTLGAMADNEAAKRFYRRHGYEPHRVEFEKSVETDSRSSPSR